MSYDSLPEDNSVNPYAPTEAVGQDSFVGPEELADRGTRLLAAIIDGFLMIFRVDRRCLHDLIAGSKVVKIQ